MSGGITGSARQEGIGRTGGVPRGAGFSAGGSQITMGDDNHSATKRAMVIWGLAVVLLVVLHVGGSSLE